MAGFRDSGFIGLVLCALLLTCVLSQIYPSRFSDKIELLQDPSQFFCEEHQWRKSEWKFLNIYGQTVPGVYPPVTLPKYYEVTFLFQRKFRFIMFDECYHFLTIKSDCSIFTVSYQTSHSIFEVPYSLFGVTQQFVFYPNKKNCTDDRKRAQKYLTSKFDQYSDSNTYKLKITGQAALQKFGEIYNIKHVSGDKKIWWD